MDWTTIIVAVLALLGSVSGSLIANRKSASLMQYRLEQLEKKVDEHNGYAKLFAENLPVLKEQMTHINERLDRVEEWEHGH